MTSRSKSVLYASDAVAFARDLLEFRPDPKQQLILGDTTRRGLLNCSRQWGKSTVTALKAFHGALYQEQSMTLIVSPSERQSREFLRKAKSFARKLDLPVKGDGDNEVSLLLPNGSRIVGVPAKEATIRGFSAVSLMIIDEASRVTDEMYRSVRPMLAVGDGALWLMSTPNGMRGFFWEAWSRNADNWTRISVPATECPRISRRFLESERAALGTRYFNQEYMCEFTGAEDQIFSEDVLMRAIRSDVKPLILPPFEPRLR